MSLSIASNGRPCSEAAPDRDAIGGFLANAVAVARAIDQRLAKILSDVFEGQTSQDASQPGWSGERRRGLELCLNMLDYLRPEAGQVIDVSRVDRGIDYIRRELSKMETPPLPPSRRHPPRPPA